MVTPSNLIQIETPTETTILNLASQSVQQEFERIKELLTMKSKSTPESKLAEYIEKLIKDFFDEQLGVIEGELVDLNRIASPSGAVSPEDIEQAWQAYIRLKTELIPHLSKDLLALIGGVYLMELKLDVMRPQDDHGLPAQSFSELATVMVKELTKGWESVLIVGEEDWNYSESEIIRLRFPACDVWHLPFTVHEFFYLLAQSEIKAPLKLKQKLQQATDQIDPLQEEWVKPVEEACYLPEIRQLWDDYIAIRGDALQWQGYSQSLTTDRQKKQAYAERIHDLVNLQRAYYCRLFADALATYYVGPAYLHALLNLEFTPSAMNHIPPQKPPIQERFVIAFEILNWMNEELTGDVRDDSSLFRRELDPSREPRGFLFLWELALKSAGVAENPYEMLKERYSDWLRIIKDILRDKKYFPAWKNTYQNWKAARQIENALLQPELKLNMIPSHWAVVNAAWSARWLYPSFEPVIHDNALWLLNLHDEKKEWYIASPSAVEEGKPRGSAAGQAWDRQAAIGAITSYLANFIIGKKFPTESNPITRWSRMMAGGNFTEDPVIFTVLVNDPKLLEDYQKLYSGG